MKLYKKLSAVFGCAVMVFALGTAALAEDEALYDELDLSFLNTDGPRLQAPGDVSLMEVEGSYPAAQAESAVAVLREAMRDRVTQVTVEITGLTDVYLYTHGPEDDSRYDCMDLCVDIYYKALEHTGDPKEGDYLDRTLRVPSDKPVGLTSFPSGDGKVSRVIIIYNLEHYQDENMEKTVDETVEKLLSDLNVEGMDSDYEKIWAVYDWMCKNVEYDREHLDNTDYLAQFTPYAALVDHKAVCQGYASLFYRLMLEMGIDCRYVSGLGNNGRHGWNIVKLGERYYYADTTWDSSTVGEYLYFLRCADDFVNHTPDADYLEESFQAAYPLTDVCYGGKAAEKVELSRTELSLEKGAKETVTALIVPEDTACTRVVWSSDNEAVATVDKGVVTAVGPGAATVTASAGAVSAKLSVVVIGEPEAKDYAVDTGDVKVPVGGGPFYAEVSVTKNSEREGEDVIVLAVLDENGAPLSLAYMKLRMNAGQKVTFGSTLDAGENCSFEAYVCESLNDATRLSE